MIRTLLATTALGALLAGAAIAQDAPAPAETAPMETPAADAADPTVTSILASGYTVTDRDNLATEIIGRQVYASAATDAEHIGDVDNLVIGENGDIAAVVIGVGGFLGIGEKHVAVNFSELEWVTTGDGTERFVLATTREALEAAPDFRTDDEVARAADGANPPAGNAMTAPAAPGALPADTIVPTDQVMPADRVGAPVAGPIDRTTLIDAPLSAEELIGTNAYGPGDEHLGAVGDVMLAADGATIEAVIIDFGGFLGIGTKPVALGVENLRFSSDANANRYLFLNVTREQLDAAPAFNADTFAAERDSQLLRANAM
ncbi:MAG: PRC-barrel domain-containing protein [Devosia sp.]|nr:PRC-barrel domain-containing protein [Devosia sp.]